MKNVLIIDDSKSVEEAFYPAYEHEDEEIRRPVMRAIWNETGEYVITFARSVEDGIKFITQRKWDLVLLDGRLPDTEHTGVQVLEFLQAHKEHLPTEIRVCSNDMSLSWKMDAMIQTLYGTKP
jgi:CheY-like chemotaxis protein